MLYHKSNRTEISSRRKLAHSILTKTGRDIETASLHCIQLSNQTKRCQFTKNSTTHNILCLFFVGNNMKGKRYSNKFSTESITKLTFCQSPKCLYNKPIHNWTAINNLYPAIIRKQVQCREILLYYLLVTLSSICELCVKIEKRVTLHQTASNWC